jgi:DNA-binding LacI/PurR family transcriptional regulator
MQQIAYSPNLAARALRSGRFGAIGLLAYHLERTGEALVAQAVTEAAAAAGYAVTLVNVADAAANGWRQPASRLVDQGVDGLIVLRAETQTMRQLALPAGLPVAVSDARLVGYYPSVVCDQTQGSLDAVHYLLNLGHPVVHHLGGPTESDPANLRAAAWRRALEQVGIKPPAELRGDWTPASGYHLGKRLAADPAVSAVYCANDEMAFGLLRALHEAGRRVPREVSVIGFDAVALSEFTSPPLTTIAQDFTETGQALVRIVIEQIRSHGQSPPGRVLLPARLVPRSTTAPYLTPSQPETQSTPPSTPPQWRPQEA